MHFSGLEVSTLIYLPQEIEIGAPNIYGTVLTVEIISKYDLDYMKY
jgi:hypothetical protein